MQYSTVFWDHRSRKWKLIIPYGTNQTAYLPLLTPQDGVEGVGEDECRRAIEVARPVIKKYLGFSPRFVVRSTRWGPDVFVARASLSRWPGFKRAA